jgi:predicted AAA+ superfamily ATPase
VLPNHPARGARWESFVIEDVLRRERAGRMGSSPWFWRTAAGAEADLVSERGSEAAIHGVVVLACGFDRSCATGYIHE